MSSTNVMEKEKSTNGSKTSEKTEFRDLDVSIDAIDTLDQFVKKIDGFTEEIDQLVSKQMDLANDSYIKQGEYIVRAKLITNHFQNSAYKTTGDIASSLESVNLTDEMAKRLENDIKEGGGTDGTGLLTSVLATLHDKVNGGLKFAALFDKLCVSTEVFCIKMEQICKNQAQQIKAYEMKGNIAAMTAIKIAFVVAIVLGVASVIIGENQHFQISNVLQISTAVVVIAGIIIFGIAKLMANKTSANVYRETLINLVSTMNTMANLQGILNKFQRVERELLCLANDVLRHIKQFKAMGEKDPILLGDYVSDLHAKCAKLHRAASDYKTAIMGPIEELDKLISDRLNKLVSDGKAAIETMESATLLNKPLN